MQYNGLYDKVQWYHCLIPSFFLHVILLCLVYFDVLGLDLHIFATEHPFDTYQIPQISIFQWETTAVILPEIPDEQPESVSPEAHIFESVEEETPIPIFHFSVQEDTDIPELPENMDNTSAPMPSQDSHSTAPSVSETVSESSASEAIIPGSASPSQGTGTPNTQRQPNTVSTNTSLPQGHSTAPDPAVTAWKIYTQKLSQHFKSHKFYPEMARRLRLSGTVKVSVKLSREGKILSVSIAESSGNAILDQAALQSAKSADPVPPFPAETTDETKMVTIPYHYTIK